ncbi:hypothetical protein I309_00838 [Cryptococcus deuterogattii LA55]|nr:hypothetical protein I309_00838 [Cryptococcus deuterogattii LA55]KIR75243.1 hypothetical protein I310_01521 [Cryptococcus deuterogattii CA1014]KIR92911.1 hypothetical protein I304_03492 [Cryptococcus deuterogattii CBS 10090]KIR98234.1 hypothetical protein L804_04696 [Cryptococcus deuterogattii 2001/935-1]
MSERTPLIPKIDLQPSSSLSNLDYVLILPGGGLITVSQVCAWDVLPMRSRPLYQAANNVTYGMTAITLFMLVINLGGSIIPWSSSANPILFILSIIITLAFFRHEKTVKLPVLPINLVTNRHMVSQVGLNLFGAMTIFGTLYLIPIFFQTTLLTSASVASRRLLYPTLTAPIASIVTGIFLHRHPNKCHVGQRLGAISLTAGALIMFALTFSNNESKGEWYFIARLIWVHAGMGVMFISSLIDILSISGTDHAVATSLVFLLRSIGTVLGISISQAILQNTLLYQLVTHFTGPGSKSIICSIRKSVDYLAQLDPARREVAVKCYVLAFRAAFGGLVGAGVWTRENMLEEEVVDEEMCNPPLSEGAPVLD